MAEKVDSGFTKVGLTENPTQLQVHSFDAMGKPAARSFHTAAFRDQSSKVSSEIRKEETYDNAITK